MFKFKPYQYEDISRSAMHDGAILGWDPGLGKTMAMFCWPVLKQSRRTLIVAPASLHEQIIKEGLEKFKVHVQPITDQKHFMELVAAGKLHYHIDKAPALPDAPLIMPEYFITDYRWLGLNKADEWQSLAVDDDADDAPEDKAYYRESNSNPIHCLRLNSSANWGVKFDHANFTNVGTTSHGITCIHAPTLSTLMVDAFDCVVCDEAVRLKSGTSHNANGVFQLNPQYRLVLTGTPIKNKLHDIFFLATWITGNHHDPTARWPYQNTSAARAEFANNHLIMEENHTRGQKNKRRQIKATNQICNLHRLWKLLAPIVVRRRKADIGSELVQKNIIPISIQPGTAQQAAYQYHVSNPPKHATPMASIGAQLSELRQVAVSPESHNLRSRSTMHTPKMHAILNIIADLVEQGEQVVVFSPFCQFSQSLSGLLRDSGVLHQLLDGSVAPLKRGALAAKFKRKEFPVLLCGMESMGEGHSFDQCSNLILPSVTWAYDINAQCIDRVHRLTSKKDVNIYAFVTKNTVDEMLANGFNEKSNTSELALDGALSDKKTADISIAELLASAIDSFDPSAETIDETTLTAAWPTTSARLIKAQTTFAQLHPTDKQQPPKAQPQPTRQPKTPVTSPPAATQPVVKQLTHYIDLAQHIVNQLAQPGADHNHLLAELKELITMAELDGWNPSDIHAALKAPTPEPTTVTEPTPAPLTSEKNGITLRLYKKGDHVYRNYNGRLEEYEIIDTKKSIWILRDKKGIDHKWNADCNGGFLLANVQSSATSTPTPAPQPTPEPVTYPVSLPALPEPTPSVPSEPEAENIIPFPSRHIAAVTDRFPLLKKFQPATSNH